VFLIQQIFTCKQYGAHRPDSQQPNPLDDLSIDKHWPWLHLGSIHADTSASPGTCIQVPVNTKHEIACISMAAIHITKTMSHL